VTHAVRIVWEMHRRHPDVSYDVTIKVEHLLRDGRYLAALADTGCLFVTTAVERSTTRCCAGWPKATPTADFGRALGLLRQHGLAVHPTFIPFHPWATPRDYGAFLERIAAYNLVASVAPIQLALRVLVPTGSLLLELPEIAPVLGPFDAGRLVFPVAAFRPQGRRPPSHRAGGRHGGGVRGAIPGGDLRSGLAPRRPRLPA
jgi:hypothetical protein